MSWVTVNSVYSSTYVLGYCQLCLQFNVCLGLLLIVFTVFEQIYFACIFTCMQVFFSFFHACLGTLFL